MSAGARRRLQETRGFGIMDRLSQNSANSRVAFQPSRAAFQPDAERGGLGEGRRLSPNMTAKQQDAKSDMTIARATRTWVLGRPGRLASGRPGCLVGSKGMALTRYATRIGLDAFARGAARGALWMRRRRRRRGVRRTRWHFRSCRKRRDARRRWQGRRSRRVDRWHEW